MISWDKVIGCRVLIRKLFARRDDPIREVKVLEMSPNKRYVKVREYFGGMDFKDEWLSVSEWIILDVLEAPKEEEPEDVGTQTAE